MGVSGGTVQAVKTRYLGPTRTLGPRVKATSSGGLSCTVDWNDDLHPLENHRAALASLVCTKLSWSANPSNWAAGGGPGGEMVWVDTSCQPEWGPELGEEMAEITKYSRFPR